MWRAPVYRNAYKKRYGSRCFLNPREKSFPICTNGKYDCKGLNAALYYTRLNKNKFLMRKVKTLKNKYCKKLKKSQ